MICYSNAKVIVRSNTLLDSSRDFPHGCEGSFENWCYLIPLINGQREGKNFFPPQPNTGMVRWGATRIQKLFKVWSGRWDA
jgi:hypothetical protein